MKAISLTENNESSISSVSSSSWSFGIKSSNKCQEDNRVYSTITDEMANEFLRRKKYQPLVKIIRECFRNGGGCRGRCLGHCSSGQYPGQPSS